MSRSCNYTSKTYGYKAYGKSLSERSMSKKEYNRKIRYSSFITQEGLSQEQLLNEEMKLFKSEEFINATADEQQEMIDFIDKRAFMEYSIVTPTRKIKGSVC